MAYFVKLIADIKVVIIVVSILGAFSLLVLGCGQGIRRANRRRSPLFDAEVDANESAEQAEDSQYTEDNVQTPAPAYEHPPVYTIDDAHPVSSSIHSLNATVNHATTVGQLSVEVNTLGLTGLDVDMGPRAATELAFMPQEDEEDGMDLGELSTLEALELDELDASVFA